MMVMAPQLALIAVVVSVVFVTLRDDMTMPSAINGYDTYQYHWAVPLLLLRNHGWQAFPGWAHANLPFATEMLNLMALSFQAPQAALLIQDAFGLLTALLLFAVVQRHFGSTTGWLVVAAETSIPVLMMYTTQSYVETALIFYGLAALATLIHFLTRAAGGDLPDWRLLALTGIFLGLALSVKYTAVEYLPAVVVLILLGLGIYLGRTDHATGRHALMQVLAALTALVGGMVVVFVPWLVKDWVLLGNPVYPALPQVFATPGWDKMRSQTLAVTFQHFGPKSGIVAQLHLYAFDLFIHPASYGEGKGFPAGSIGDTAGIGVPYIAYQLWRTRRAGWAMPSAPQFLTLFAIGASGVGALAVWTLSGALVERYALPGVVLITVFAATSIGWILSRLPKHLYAVTWLVVGMMTLVCFVQVIAVFVYNYAERDPLPVLTGSVSEHAFQRMHAGGGLPLDFYQTVDYVNQWLPHDGKLLMIGRGTGYFFTNRDY
ncbi:MAG TPA: glycosyltransferase family 39 protein, partial [Chthonomonadales bacterium]|nr:glycosyltransferase family 39 protein [Chthonomonadales bacterium]